MLPRRSYRLRQLNDRKASSSMSSPIDETSKPTKKRARTEPNIEIEDANQPKQKKKKLAAYNLESFPVEILEKIFMKTADTGLLNLANTCTRFEAIAQTVFSMRYAAKYFTINSERYGGDPEIYAALFGRFGNIIKAIRISHIIDFGATSKYWVTKLIRPHINRIEKIVFNDCKFNGQNILLRRMNNVTHLAFRDVTFAPYKYFDLPECHKLIALEISRTRGFTTKSLQQTIYNNPALQRVILKGFYNHEDEYAHFSIISSIVDHLNDIKELVLWDGRYWDNPPSASAIERIVNSFKRLESFSISASVNLFEVLQRLAKESNKLKHLGQFRYDGEVDNATIRSFSQIESLHLIHYSNFYTQIDFPANLRHLFIQKFDFHKNDFSDLLPMLHQCQSLQQITMITDTNTIVYPNDFITAEFFEEFNETVAITGKSSARIEVMERDQTIGCITVDGIVWQNKLMYWMDCDKNSTNIRLLDLADHFDESNKAKNVADQTNLLDKIFDYLDLESLAELGRINERSKQLAKNYVEKCVKLQKTIFTTDELYTAKYFSDSHIFDNFRKYTALITDLSVCSLGNLYISEIIANYKLLNKLSIYDKKISTCWQELHYNYDTYNNDNILHVVCDSPYFMGYSDLIGLIEIFAKVQTMEFKNASQFNDLKSIKSNAKKFSKLKKFIFNYRGETQMNNLKEIFKNTTVQLVPVFRKSVK